jgi:hypothetical protein
MPHQNHPHIPPSLLFNLFHQIRQLVFRMSDLILQAIRWLFPPFHRLDLGIVHFETRETPAVDLEFDIAVS